MFNRFFLVSLQCSKEKGGTCRRTRAVLCMIGNRSTTDVKICGEDDLVFTSEDCDCDGELSGYNFFQINKKLIYKIFQRWWKYQRKMTRTV